MRATWYVLEDGTAVDPKEVSRNEDGALAHKNGLVAMRFPDCPRSIGVDVDDNGKAEGPPAAIAPEPEAAVPAQPEVAVDADHAEVTTDMTPEPQPIPAKQPGYKTRRGR